MNKITVDFLTASVADLITYTNHECDRIQTLWATGRQAPFAEIEAGFDPLGGELQQISGEVHGGSTTFGTDQRLLTGYGGEDASQSEGNRGLFSEVPRSPGPSSAFFCDETYGESGEDWDFLDFFEPVQADPQGTSTEPLLDLSSRAERNAGLPNTPGRESGGWIFDPSFYTDQAEFASAIKAQAEKIIRRSRGGNGRTKADERRLAETYSKLSASRATEFTTGRGGCPLGPFRTPRRKKTRAEEGKIPLQPPPKKRKLNF